MTFISLRAIGGALLAAIASFSSANAEATHYPLTLENCGRSIRIDHPPRRIVSIGQSSTEILYRLGLGERVAATAVWVGPVLKGYEAEDARVKRLAENDPSFESVLAEKPDLVTAQFQWHIGPQGAVAKPEQFGELGIPVYISPADCLGKDAVAGSDGVRHDRFTMELIYREILDLAKINDVSDRGEALVRELKIRETTARARLASVRSGLSAVFWFSSQKDADPYVAGRNGAPGYIMQALGLKNVVETDEEWPTVGWETLAKANPSLIVAARMDRRRYPLDSIEAKRSFLQSDAVASLIPAVRQGHVFELDAQAMNPTIRTIDGIEALADAISASDLGK
ncbi:ABC transporter substrate-binding protein [Allorhizobium undicola]|uniref:ABC transporter substrate-binding protein n=1 Tax=Allorhizobium undicola TaxID=78527 RepID=UPI00048706E5|nr:ABC transporter substrate-binding protein [Allorhizobium undicola]